MLYSQRGALARSWRLNRSCALQANSYGEATGLLVLDISSTLSHTSGQIETTPDHGAEDKTTSMMTNIIPLVIKDVLKVKIFQDCMLHTLCLLPIRGSANYHMPKRVLLRGNAKEGRKEMLCIHESLLYICREVPKTRTLLAIWNLIGAATRQRGDLATLLVYQRSLLGQTCSSLLVAPPAWWVKTRLV